MLDYTALKIKFDEISESITQREFKEWIEFDKKRMSENLINGDTIILKSNDISIVNINDDKLMEITTNENYAYAMAA
jgi:DNA-directed RNA polymerase specialized sigma54-like protein